jgi:hypothetical protein
LLYFVALTGPIAQAIGCFISIFDVVLLPWSLVEQCYDSTRDLDELETSRDDELLNYHLIEREGRETYKLHELIREFFQSKLIELEQTDHLWQAITLKVAAIVKQNPSLAAKILHKRWLDWQWVSDIGQLSAGDWGWQVRIASQAWIDGLGPLADITFPRREDGTLPTIGVGLVQKNLDQPWGPNSYVQIGWNFSSPRVEMVVDLPPESCHAFGDDATARTSARIALSDAGWNHFQSELLSPQVSCVWWQTFESIRSELTRRLKDRSLPVPAGYLSLEAAWYAAARILNRDPFSTAPMPLDALGEPLLRTKLSSLTLRMQQCYKQLQIEVLLAYATDIHQGAVDGYEQILTTWLSRLRPTLPLVSIFPAQLAGFVVPPNPGSEKISISWFWQPLPENQLNGVDFRLSNCPILDDPRWQATPEKFRNLRPHALMEPRLIDCTMSLSTQWLGVCPVTELVYQWLWNDLYKAGYVKSEKLENVGHPYWR